VFNPGVPATTGDLFLVQGQVKVTKGATGGTTQVRLASLGTADVLFFGGTPNSYFYVMNETNQPANSTYVISVMGIATVGFMREATVVDFELGVQSDGSSGTIAVSDAQLVAYRIKG